MWCKGARFLRNLRRLYGANRETIEYYIHIPQNRHLSQMLTSRLAKLRFYKIKQYMTGNNNANGIYTYDLLCINIKYILYVRLHGLNIVIIHISSQSW